MDDVVDLLEGLRCAGEKVRGTVAVGFEPADVTLPQIDTRDAFHDPFGHDLAYTTGMCDPHCFRDPEAVELSGRAEQGKAIGRERKDSVHPLIDLYVTQSREELLRVGPGLFEVVRREVHHRWHDCRLVVARQRVRGDGHRAVLIGPNAVAVPAVSEIHRTVLVAKDRVGHFGSHALELRKRRGPRVLVLHWR